MEHHGSSGQLAVTNMDTVVIVASFDTNVSSLPASAVQLQLDSGQGGVVSEVQGFPGQPNVFLIEVCCSRNPKTLPRPATTISKGICITFLRYAGAAPCRL